MGQISILSFERVTYKPSNRVTHCKNCHIDDPTGTLPWINKPLPKGSERYLLTSAGFGINSRNATLCKECLLSELVSLENMAETIKLLLK